MGDLEACPCWGILEVVGLVGKECQLGQNCFGYGPKKGGLASFQLDTLASG